jgi:hypothetical protein
MNYHPLVAAILFLLLGWFPIAQADDGQQATRGFDPLRGWLARSEPQSIYAPDPEDAWNQVFFLLFTRTIASRAMADGAPALPRATTGWRSATGVSRGSRAATARSTRCILPGY